MWLVILKDQSGYVVSYLKGSEWLCTYGYFKGSDWLCGELFQDQSGYVHVVSYFRGSRWLCGKRTEQSGVRYFRASHRLRKINQEDRNTGRRWDNLGILFEIETVNGLWV